MIASLFARVRVRPDRDECSCAPPPPTPQVGLQTVALESYRDWQIEVARSPLGGVVQRDTFRALIQPIKAGREEYLSGFPTLQAALIAARQRIDLVSISPTRRWHAPHEPIRRPHRLINPVRSEESLRTGR